MGSDGGYLKSTLEAIAAGHPQNSKDTDSPLTAVILGECRRWNPSDCDPQSKTARACTRSFALFSVAVKP